MRFHLVLMLLGKPASRASVTESTHEVDQGLCERNRPNTAPIPRGLVLTDILIAKTTALSMNGGIILHEIKRQKIAENRGPQNSSTFADPFHKQNQIWIKI